MKTKSHVNLESLLSATPPFFGFIAVWQFFIQKFFLLILLILF